MKPKKTVKADITSIKKPVANTIFIDKLNQVLLAQEVKKVDSLKLAFAYAKKVPDSTDQQKAQSASAALVSIANLNDLVLKSFANGYESNFEFKKKHAEVK